MEKGSDRVKRRASRTKAFVKPQALCEQDSKLEYPFITCEGAQQISEDTGAHVRALYNKAAQAIASTDDNGKFIEVNPAFRHMFGYTRAEALKLTHLDITAPEYRQISKEKAQALFRREIESYRLEKLYLRKNGSVFWGDVSVAAVHTPDNRVQSAAIIVDISDRKEAEEALKKARDELELRVAKRTEQLAGANRELHKEIAERNQGPGGAKA